MVSLKTLEKKYHVSYDSKKRGGSFVCETPDGEVVFSRCPRTGFPYVDLDEEGENTAVLLVQAQGKTI